MTGYWATFQDKVLLHGRPGDSPLWKGMGDLEAFVSLFLQNVTNMVVMADLLTNPFIVGLEPSTVHDQIIPAVAVSVCIGNVAAWWQARHLARRTEDPNVCALPFGINTPQARLTQRSDASISHLDGPRRQSIRAHSPV